MLPYGTVRGAGKLSRSLTHKTRSALPNPEPRHAGRRRPQYTGSFTGLDLAAMRRAAGALVGRHDFKAFESTEAPCAHPAECRDGGWVEERTMRRPFRSKPTDFCAAWYEISWGPSWRSGWASWHPVMSDHHGRQDRKRAGPSLRPRIVPHGSEVLMAS
jgi:hypothetical protein